MGKKVLLGGGSGLVGNRLSQLLTNKGYDVWVLSRSAKGKKNTIELDVKNQKLDASAIADYDHIINLTGAGIVDCFVSDESSGRGKFPRECTGRGAAGAG